MYEGHAPYNDKEYIALLGDIFVNPNNKTKTRCRSEYFRMITKYFNGGLVDGDPKSKASSTLVTVSAGGGINLGFQGQTPIANITGTFNISKTNNKYDLIISGFREKINEGDNITRQFRVDYNYRDGTRNNVPYLYSSSALRYLVIYEKNDYTNKYKIPVKIYSKFTYDAPWPKSNKAISQTFYVSVDVDTSINEVTIN